jgi:hypothetical protein
VPSREGSSSSSSSSSSDTESAALDDGEVSQPALRIGEVLLQHDVSSWVEGVHLEHNEHRLGEPDAYRRFGVTCMHHLRSSKGHSCHKWRNIGPEQTSRWGELEAVGFLGAWLASASQHVDRRCHMHRDLNPTLQQVDQWLRDNRYLGVPS